MRLLALDTATPLCGVAVLDTESGRSATRRERVTTHSERLLSLIAEVLGELSMSPRDLGAVVCGAGPGSFTGLRIGAATSKGLCFALSVPLVLVSSLRTLAAQCAEEKENGPLPVLACIDAWQGQVYAQLLVSPWQSEVPGAEIPLAIPAELLQERAWSPEDLITAVARCPLAGRLRICGDAPLRYPELLRLGAASPEAGDRDPPQPGMQQALADPYPDPLVLARLGAARLARGEQDPLATSAPNYVCQPAIRLPPGHQPEVEPARPE